MSCFAFIRVHKVSFCDMRSSINDVAVFVRRGSNIFDDSCKKRYVSGSINDVTPIEGRIKWLCDDSTYVRRSNKKTGEGVKRYQSMSDVIHERSLYRNKKYMKY